MKIAIPTNDRITIAKRTGKATEIAFYVIDNGAIKSVTYTKNTHSHDDHGRNDVNYNLDEREELNYDKLLDILIDVDLLLVKAVGKYMKKTLQKANINYQLVSTDAISEILKDYL